MKSASPYVFIDNCNEVMEYYHSLFGGEITNIQKVMMASVYMPNFTLVTASFIFQIPLARSKKEIVYESA